MRPRQKMPSKAHYAQLRAYLDALLTRRGPQLATIALYALLMLFWWLPMAKAEHAFKEPITEIQVNQIADAIYLAEGGAKAKKPYGILSIPCDTHEECRRICKNTVRNNWHRWNKSDRSRTYLEFLANRYAPVGAENDPTGLNRHWLKNVTFFLSKPQTY